MADDPEAIARLYPVMPESLTADSPPLPWGRIDKEPAPPDSSELTARPDPYPWADTPTRIANCEYSIGQAGRAIEKLVEVVRAMETNVKDVLRQHDVKIQILTDEVESLRNLKQEPVKKLLWERPSPTQVNPGWCLLPGTEFTAVKSIGQMEATSLTEFTLRSRFGYLPDGLRVLSGADLEAAYKLCERLAKSTSPEEADTVVMGAGNLPLDVATARVCLGLTSGGKHGTTPLMSALKYYPEHTMEDLLKGLT